MVRALYLLPILCICVFSVAAAEPGELEKVKIPPSTAKAEQRRGLEAGWWAPEPNSNPATLSTVVAEEQADNRLLRMDYKGGVSDKSAIKKQTGFAIADNGKVRALIYSAEENPPSISIALVTGADFAWQETETTKLKKGWNEVSIDASAKVWKSKATEWKNEAPLVAQNDVRAIALNVYNGQNSGALYLDAIQVDRGDSTTEIEAQIQKLSDAAAREEAEKALIKSGRAAIESLNLFLETCTDKDAIASATKVLEKVGAKPVVVKAPPAPPQDK